MSGGNKSWTVQIPSLTGMNAMDPTMGGKLPTGAYRVKILESEQKAEGTSISFTVEVVDGPHAGVRTWVNQGLDFAKDGNKKSWVALLLGIGATRAQIDSPQGLSLNAGSFTNRAAFVYVKALPEGEKGYDNRNFVTPDQFATITAAAQVQAATQPQGVGSAIPQPVAAIPQVGQPAAFGAAQPAQLGGGMTQLGAAVGVVPLGGIPAPTGGVQF